jgi:predicted O-linked N-acetylglucosamine transferase (SPINDLY family)
MFEQLDPERFEVLLFVHRRTETPVEAYALSRVAEFHVLPAIVAEQVEALRAAQLDVVVFGTNVTAVFNEVTQLALHRVAPLQVVNNSSCTTSGLPEIDLYVSGTMTESAEAPAQFTERLGLLPGPAHAFNYSADRQEPTTTWTRAALGLPEDAVVFVTAANYFKIIPEMQATWARLLAAVPGSRLLVHPFNPNWSSTYPIRRFCRQFDQVLAAHGVSADRLVVSTARFPSREDVKELLRVGDLYLDTFPFGGVNSLVDPLELGLPVVAWEGDTFRARMGGALLRALGLDELIATDEAGYLERAARLARDATGRAALKARITEAMDRTPVFLDPLAASDATGDLLEAAYDELTAVGREMFRANRTPLQATSASADAAEASSSDPAAAAGEILRRAPADPKARHQLGRTLLAAGRTQRAATYLLAALQGEENNAELWLDVARALQADGKLDEALTALEAGLKIDQNLLEGWVLFAELAHTLGSTEIAREAAGVAQRLAPGDTRVMAFL